MSFEKVYQTRQVLTRFANICGISCDIFNTVVYIDYSIFFVDIFKISTQPPGALAGEAIDCRCRGVHTVNTGQILFGAGASAGIGASMATVVPPGSKIAVITEKVLYEDIVRGVLRRLERAGYRSEVHCFLTAPMDTSVCDDVFEGHPVFETPDDERIKQIHEGADLHEVALAQAFCDGEEGEFCNGFPEDAKVVLGIGSGSVIDAAKYIATVRGLPCYIVATSPTLIGCLTPSAMLMRGGFIEVFKVKPPAAVLCDTDFFDSLPQAHAAAAVGEIAGVLTALFDWRMASLLTNEPFCPFLADVATDCIDLLIEKLGEDAVVLPFEMMGYAAECSLRLSAISQMIGNSRLTCGGETHLTHAYLMLLNRQRRERRLYGEYIGMATINALNLYIHELEFNIRSGFMPPPDNNVRMDKIAGYFGVPWMQAGDKISPLYTQRILDVTMYKLTECRSELLAWASSAQQKAEKLRHYARRMYSDFGYSLNHHITQADTDMCLALAPDIREKFSFLTQLKNMGLLERLLD